MLLSTVAKSEYSMSDNMDDPKDVWPHIIKSKSSFFLKAASHLNRAVENMQCNSFYGNI